MVYDGDKGGVFPPWLCACKGLPTEGETKAIATNTQGIYMGMIDITGACDLHIHTGPDVFDRIADDVQTARFCMQAGMRAIVFKCHADTTMLRAYHTQR